MLHNPFVLPALSGKFLLRCFPCGPTVCSSHQVLTCSRARKTVQTAHRRTKKAGAAFSCHMRHRGLIVLVEMAQGIGTGGMLLIKTVGN